MTLTNAVLLSPRPYGQLPRTSTETVQARVDGTGIDPARHRVWLGFTTGDPPTIREWQRARWSTTTSHLAGIVAEIMIGPNTFTRIQPGQWWVWVRVDDHPASVHRRAGYFTLI